MRGKLKSLAGQIVVVTGEASGLGLDTARRAALAGAAVVLAAADERAARSACSAIGEAGGRAHPVVADVATFDGCDRVARAAVARFGRIDSWIDASGEAAAPACAARALAKHLGLSGGPGALVVFGARIGRAARSELRQAKGRVTVTLIKLPRDWRHDSPTGAAVDAALHAVVRPVGLMTLAPDGESLTAATQVKKHSGVVAGVGLLALVGIAAWLGRGRIAEVATAARPRLARAVGPSVRGVLRARVSETAGAKPKPPRRRTKIANGLH